MSLVSITQAVARLQAEDVVAIPTETVYGLAGRMDSEVALKKIFETKSRPFFDPLIVHVTSVEQAKSLAVEWPAPFEALASKLWPGPMTLVVKKAAHVSSLITSGLDTVAIRWPAHPVAQELIAKLGVPVAAPSANRFGRTSPTSVQHVEEEFDGHVAVVEGGACQVGVESTVVSVWKNANDVWELAVLRPGGVSKSDLKAVLDKSGLKFEISSRESSASPGHLKHHYQPDCPVVYLKTRPWSLETEAEIRTHFDNKFSSLQRLQFPLAPVEAARRLYESFRMLAKTPGGLIVVERSRAQEGENWEAIWDRVERASSLIL